MGDVISFPDRSSEHHGESIDPHDILTPDTILWQCECGSSLFFLLQDGARCHVCGAYSTWLND